MKIVQVIDRLEVGGAERVLVDLTNLLHENQYQVSVVCLLQEGKLEEQLHPDIAVTYIRREQKYHPKYLFRLYKELIKNDIIHVHLRQVLRYVSLLFYLKTLHKKRVVIFHDHFGEIAVDKAIGTSIKSAIKRCSAYIGVSNELVSWANTNQLNTNIFKLSNIIRSTPSQIKQESLENDTKIVAVGNFRPQKNYEYLLELIQKSPETFKYTIYGQPVDKNYFETIRSKIQALEISGRVEIITDSNDIKNELYKYDIGIHTATSETGPLSAIEYLGANIPYISYNTGEVAEVVIKKFDCFIQNNFNITNWLSSMDAILETKEVLQKEIPLFYKENFSEDGYLKSCVSLYKTLLNSK